LLARRQAERHVVEQLAVNRRRKRRFRNERPPGDVAGIKRRQLGQALLANGGAKTVRPHQQLPLRRAAISEMHGHRPPVLLEGLDAAAAVIALLRERIAQHAVDPLPGGENLRACELCSEPAGRIEDFSGGDLDPEVGRIDAEPPQRRDQIRLRDDAGAAAGEFALDPLEHGDVPAGPAQQQRSQEAAHGAAGDERAPLARPGQFARSRHFLPPKLAIYRAKLGGMPWP
jgi:hypothetical protein